MKQTLENLLRIQELSLTDHPLKKNETAELLDREARVDGRLVSRMERMFDRGRKAIVPVRGQSCGGCHLELSRSTMLALRHGKNLQACQNCGRILYLPETEEDPAALAD